MIQYTIQNVHDNSLEVWHDDLHKLYHGHGLYHLYAYTYLKEKNQATARKDNHMCFNQLCCTCQEIITKSSCYGFKTCQLTYHIFQGGRRGLINLPKLANGWWPTAALHQAQQLTITVTFPGLQIQKRPALEMDAKPYCQYVIAVI